MGCQHLALPADVRDRGHLPECPLGHRADREQAARKRAVPILESTGLTDIEAEPQRIRTDIAPIEQAADQGMADPVIIASRARAVDHADGAEPPSLIAVAGTIDDVD